MGLEQFIGVGAEGSNHRRFDIVVFQSANLAKFVFHSVASYAILALCKSYPSASNSSTASGKAIFSTLTRPNRYPTADQFRDFVFVSRPRRFGKSLLVFHLQHLFQGRRELFRGLWIEDKIDWQPARFW